MPDNELQQMIDQMVAENKERWKNEFLYILHMKKE